MATEPVTTDFILETMKGYVESRVPVAPLQWLEAAMKLQALSSDEADKLVEAEHVVAKLKLGFLEAQEKRNVSEAKAKVEASAEYRYMRRQRARVDQIQEFVMLAKKISSVRDGEYRSG